MIGYVFVAFDVTFSKLTNDWAAQSFPRSFGRDEGTNWLDAIIFVHTSISKETYSPFIIPYIQWQSNNRRSPYRQSWFF
jgi:hypothetical protein